MLTCCFASRVEATIPATPLDFDNDGKSDIATFDPATATWQIYLSGSRGSSTTLVFGAVGDVPVPGDYNCDGITDIAVFRPSTATWYLAPSGGRLPGAPWQCSNGSCSVQFGSPGDIPVPADYNGDHTTDVAVFHPSNAAWYFAPSNGTLPKNLNKPWTCGVTCSAQYGTPGTVPVPGDLLSDDFGSGNSPSAMSAVGDMPVPGDYDGDGTTDLAVFHPSNAEWYILPSGGFSQTAPYCKGITAGNMCGVQYGEVGADIPVAGDYDGDGTTDIAVFRPTTTPNTNCTWLIWLSRTGGQSQIPFGPLGAIPIPGNYDGKTDIAVFVPSVISQTAQTQQQPATWYVGTSQSLSPPWQCSSGSCAAPVASGTMPLPRRTLAVPLARPIPAGVLGHYNYEPTGFVDVTGTKHVWWCGDDPAPGNQPPNSPQIGDSIWYSQADPKSGAWSQPVLQIGYNAKYPNEWNAACSPTVVQYPVNGPYHMFYECLDGDSSTANICAAQSTNGGQSWSIWTNSGWQPSQPGQNAPHAVPILQVPPNTAGYGIGRPSAVVTNGQLFLYYYYQNTNDLNAHHGEVLLTQMNTDALSFASPGNLPGAAVTFSTPGDGSCNVPENTPNLFFPVHVYGVDNNAGLQGYMAVLGAGQTPCDPNAPPEGNNYLVGSGIGRSFQLAPHSLGYASSSCATTPAILSDPYGHLQETGPASSFELISAESPVISAENPVCGQSYPWHADIWPVYGTITWPTTWP